MERELLRKVQLTQLEMLKELHRVCTENHIRYFLYCGTFLGAVRHKGFIPWDDDLDVGMLREDYERFRRIAPEKLSSGYCFQDWHTDPAYPHSFGKLRKQGTVYKEAKTASLKEDGFYVDIFPLDNAYADEQQQNAFVRKLMHLYRLKLMKGGNTPWMEDTGIVWKKRIGYLAYQAAALFTTQEQLIQKFDAMVAQVPDCGKVYEQSGLSTEVVFDRSLFAETADYPFEDGCFPGPKDFDRVLTILYGDYMQLPPEDKRENRHQVQKIDFGV